MKRKKGRDSLAQELKRQLVHVSGIVFVLSLIHLGKSMTVILTGIALLIAILIAIHIREKKRIIWPLKIISRMEKRLQNWAGGFERPGELPMGGAITYGLGVIFTLELFAPELAVPAILVLALADSASTLVGRRLGRNKLFINRKKSWEGSTAFLVACFVVLLFFANPTKAIAVAVLVTIVEAMPKIDDNISIPIAVALLLSF
ncbi:MAG: diacylglycerol/polyprenol kinase family protein [Candidatus Aenigmatarchaeota archaeon]